MQNYIAIGISSSAATLKVVMEGCDIKNSDRAFPVAEVACFDRHVTKSRSSNF